MKLKNIIILSHILIFLCGFIAVGYTVHFKGMQALNQLEMKSLLKANDQMFRALDAEMDKMVTIVKDYAIWDDPYQFMIDHNDEFIESNMTEDSIRNVNTLGFLTLTLDFQEHYSYTYAGKEELYRSVIRQLIEHRDLVLRSLEEDEGKILLYNDDANAFVWSVLHPVLPTAADKPANGYLVFSVVLDESFIQRISDNFGRAISFSDPMREGYSANIVEGSYSKQVFIESDENAVIQDCVIDATGAHSFCFEAVIDRDISNMIHHLIDRIQIFFYVLGTVVTLLNLWVIFRYITRPGMLLARHFELIAKKQDFSKRLEVIGPHEMQQIALSANTMLTQLENLHSSVEHLSRTDGLTQLYNKTYFNELMVREYQRSVRNDKTLGIALVDIDFFKKYNDNYGHLQGDVCLAKVAMVLKKVLQRPGDVVARFGGEEFVILLPETSLSGLTRVADNMQAKIAEAKIPHAFSDVAPYVTVSLGGVVFTPAQGVSIDEAFHKADELLYRAKAEGRNRIIVEEYKEEV